MARKKRSKLENSRYDTVLAFREVRDALTKHYREKLKLLESVATHVFSELEEPLWLSAKFLSKAREETGLSQSDLARASGLQRSLIAQYEAGHKLPRLDNVRKIYEVLESMGHSVHAANGLRGSRELSKAVSLASLRMLDNEQKGIDGARAAIEALVRADDAEILRLDQKVKEAVVR